MTDNRKRRPKPEILISLKLWKVQLKLQRQIWAIRPHIGGKQFPTTGSIDMPAKTGNNYISGTLADSVEMPTPNWGFSMMSSSTEVWPNDCDKYRPPEITWLVSKTSVLPFPVVGRCRNARGQFLRAGRGRKLQSCRWNCHPICHSARDVSISGFGGHIAISGCRSLPQSPDDTLFGFAMVENLGLAVEISTLSVVVPVV